MASTACHWVFMRVAEFFLATLQDGPTLWSRPTLASSTGQMLPSPLDFTKWDDTADDRGWFASHICPSCWAGVGATFLVGGQFCFIGCSFVVWVRQYQTVPRPSRWAGASWAPFHSCWWSGHVFCSPFLLGRSTLATLLSALFVERAFGLLSSGIVYLFFFLKKTFFC